MKKITLTVGQQILMIVALLSTFLGTLVWMTKTNMADIDRTYGAIVANEIPKMKLLQVMTRESNAIQRAALRLLIEDEPAEISALKGRIQKSRETNIKAIDDIGLMLRNPKGKEVHAEIARLRSEYVKNLDPLIEMAEQQRKTEAREWNKTHTLPAFNAFQAKLTEFTEFQVTLAETTGAAAADKTQEIIRKSLLVGIGAIVLGIVMALIIAARLNKKLTGICSQLTQGSIQLAAAADQVSVSSQQLAEGASEQAASIEETSASLEEITSMTKSNAESATNARGFSDRMKNAADSGASDMREMIDAMSQISAIIKTIDEIAFQTNILALNAAVEAARAGESGAGFAVVADEVRNLAKRSADAAKESSHTIERGVLISQKMGVSLNTIVENISKVSSLVGEIAGASREQSEGIDQINIAVSQMDKVIQNSAATAEETASASEELNAQAATLNDTVSELASLVGIAGSDTSAPRFTQSGSVGAGAHHNFMSATHTTKSPTPQLQFGREKNRALNAPSGFQNH